MISCPTLISFLFLERWGEDLTKPMWLMAHPSKNNKFVPHPYRLFLAIGWEPTNVVSSPTPSGLLRFPDAHCLHFITFSCYRRQKRLGTAGARDWFVTVLERARKWYGFYVVGFV